MARDGERERERDGDDLEDLEGLNGNLRGVKVVRTGRVFYGKTCWCLSLRSPSRRTFIRLAERPWVENAVLLAIVSNCVFLAVQGAPGAPGAFFPPAKAEAIELFFTMLFTVEMITKIIALGFVCHRGSYLRDNWNRLDFVVVCLAWAPLLFPSLENMSAMRSVRALRPLRTINRMPGMKRQVDTMLRALPKLSDVVMLFAFFALLFGVLGVQLFRGTLLHRCYAEDAAAAVAAALAAGSTEPDAAAVAAAATAASHADASLAAYGGLADLPASAFPYAPLDAEAGVCGQRGSVGSRGSCAEGEACLFYGLNPTYGTNSFDSIGWAWMTIFQCVTLEGWVDVMYMAMAAVDPSASIYFVLLVFLGAFYVLNLFLAVLYDTYEETGQRPDAEEEDEEGERPRESVSEREGPAIGSDESDRGALLHGTQRSDRDADEPLVLPTSGCRVCLRKAMEQPAVASFVMLLILVNTGIMMAEKYPMDPQREVWLEQVNVVLTLAFLTEMLLKLGGYGLRGYVADKMNRFDGAIVIMSVVDLIITECNVDLGINTSVLRAFRLMRVFKLVRSWTGLRRVLSSMLIAIDSLSNLFALVILVIFIFALLGMQLFGLRFTKEAGFEEPPRANFDSITNSMITVFIIVSGENWNDVWADTKHAVGEWSAPFFILIVVVGNYIVLNLFVAILIGGFNEESQANDDEPPPPSPPRAEEAEESRVSTPDSSRRNSHSVQEALGICDKPALCCLGPENPLRVLCARLVVYRSPSLPIVSFDNTIILTILVACGAMALETCGLDPASEFAAGLALVNAGATLVFVVEMAAKVIAHGLLLTPTAYLRSGWNRLDAVIVCSSLLALFGGANPAMKTMRMLRVLRPLRLIARFSGMRLVVNLLMRTLPNVGNVMAVCTLFVVIFGILGVQLFAGKLADCHGVPPELEAAATNAAECAAAGGHWRNPDLGNFDDIGAAVLLLFESATFEGWPDVMFAGIDAYRQGQAPRRNYNAAQGLYMMLWIVIGGMFLLNVFVGMIVDTFNRVKKEDEGLNIMSADQQKWVETMENLLKVKPTRYPPEPRDSAVRLQAYRLIRMPLFEPFILLVIMGNTLIMMLEGYGISAELASAIDWGNNFCTYVFVLEAATKITALSFAEYILHGWNVFDFVVAATSLLVVLMESLAASLGMNPSVLRAVRTVRVLRIVRTVKSFKGLRNLFTTLILSLPKFVNILAIFLIVLVLYGILGMQVFGRVVHGDYLNDDANFCTFPTSFVTMLRSSTGESWNGLMHDLMVTEKAGGSAGECTDAEGNCGNPVGAVLFFVSFTILSAFVILNMIVAIILEEFARSSKPDLKVSPEDTDKFVDAWCQFDPFATGKMHVRHMHSLIRSLPPPLGLDARHFPFNKIRDTDISSHISQMEGVSTYVSNLTGAPEVAFIEVLNALTKGVYGSVVMEVESGGIESKIVRELRRNRERAMAEQRARDKPKNNLVELHSVCTIQRRWKATAPQRAARNLQNRREAIRLRQQGTLVPDAFAGRVQHSSIVYKGRLFVFGGRGADGMLRDFWEYSLNAGFWTDQSHTVPLKLQARCGHEAILAHSRMLIVGGHDGTNYLSDVWECDLNGLYWRQLGFTAQDKLEQEKRVADAALKLSDESSRPGSRSSEATGASGRSAADGPNDVALAASRGRRVAAAELVQAHARGGAARRDVAARRAAAELQYDAATYVQALWRGSRMRGDAGRAAATGVVEMAVKVRPAQGGGGRVG